MWSDDQIVECKRKGCNSKVIAKGLCSKHYQKQRFLKANKKKYCESYNCYAEAKIKGLCKHHYNVFVYDKKYLTCSLEGCEEMHHAKGMCLKHYMKEYRRTKK